MCSSQFQAVYMSYLLPWGHVCVCVRLYNSLIRDGTALVLTDFKFTPYIPPFLALTVHTHTRIHTDHTIVAIERDKES